MTLAFASKPKCFEPLAWAIEKEHWDFTGSGEVGEMKAGAAIPYNQFSFIA